VEKNNKTGWSVIILALLGVALLFVCCVIHCKIVSICISQMQINSITYLLTCLLSTEIRTDLSTGMDNVVDIE